MNSPIRVAALSMVALLLAICPTQQALPQTSPNMVIEAHGAGLARLSVRLLAEGMKEPVQFDFKGSEGSVSGGIALPKEGSAEYEIIAYDAYGYVTHSGKGSIGGFVHNDRPVVLPLHPKDDGDELIVSLTRERIEIDVKQSSETPDEITMRAQVFGPQGSPMEIKPGDLTWQLTDGRYVRLVPTWDPFEFKLVPNGKLTTFELCDLSPQVSACLPNHCRPIRVCSSPWVQVSAGGTHTCALTQGGAAFCWGSNSHGELGAATTTACNGNPTTNQKCSTRPLPVTCPAGAPCQFTQISAGQTLTAAVDINGDVWWWGRGASAHRKVNAVLAGSPVTFSSVAAGYGHGCAIATARKEIWCWGTNGYGEAGAPRTIRDVPDTAPVRVLVPLKFKRIVAGGEHTCAIGDTGVDVVCWGRDDWRQTSGPNSTQAPATGAGPFFFQQFGGLVQILDVAVSPTTTCVTLASGVRCWGENHYYDVTGFGTPDLLTAGVGQICATSAQQATCMGSNNWGELGIGTMAYQAAPVAVKNPPPLYSDLSAGDAHTCGVTPAGELFCWGKNVEGQVGNGALSYSVKEPTLVTRP